MIRYSLLGRHSRRTPLAYDSYKSVASGLFTQVTDHRQSDIVILGFVIDIEENQEEICQILSRNPSAKFVVVSEEPLWDTVWSGDYLSKLRRFAFGEVEFEVVCLNHFNSNLFEIYKIPYYITTEHYFISRYRSLFQRNLRLSASDFYNVFRNKTGEAYFLEYRENDRFGFQTTHATGLSVFRSMLASLRKKEHDTVLVEGKGWNTADARQSLIDWHLDKISKIDAKFKFCSAIENTDAPNYISEKYFDALATMSIPLISTRFNENVLSAARTRPFINFSPNASPEESCTMIDSFKLTQEFTESYRNNIEAWHSCFADLELYLFERLTRVKRLHSVLSGIL